MQAGTDPWQAARHEAEAIRAAGWRTVVLDTERGMAGAGFARTVAGWLGAECLRLGEWAAVGSRQSAVGGAAGLPCSLLLTLHYLLSTASR